MYREQADGGDREGDVGDMSGLWGFRREDALRFDSLRNRVFRMIGKELEEDSYCKSYEGAIDIDISYPNYFEEEKPVACFAM